MRGEKHRGFPRPSTLSRERKKKVGYFNPGVALNKKEKRMLKKEGLKSKCTLITQSNEGDAGGS